MFAQGADEILGQFIAFVEVAANFANKAFFLGLLGLRLDVCVVISISYAFAAAENFGIGDLADKHSVAAQIHALYLQAAWTKRQ